MRWLPWIFKRLAGSLVGRIILFLFKDHPWWISGVSAVSGVLAFLAGLLPWQIWVLAAIGLFSFFMAIRQTWFPHGFRNKKPQPAQPPAQEESELQRQMLSFIISLIGERPVTTTEIYCREPFLEICPSALHQAFIHLQTNGYIIAEEDPGNNPMAARSTRMFTVTAVTDKGRKP